MDSRVTSSAVVLVEEAVTINLAFLYVVTEHLIQTRGVELRV